MYSNNTGTCGNTVVIEHAAIIDGGTAYIVDEKLNKVQTIGKAKSVSTYGQLFLIKLNNGSATYYLVD